MIPVLFLIAAATIAIASLGLVLALRMRPHFKAEEVGALRDKIPYRKLIADGVVQLSGGRLIVGWQIDGADFGSMTFKQQASAVTTAAQGVMNSSGGGELLQIDWTTFRESRPGHPKTSAELRDPTSATMYGLRVEHFETPGKQYVNESYMMITWTPPGFLMDALGALATDGDGDRWDRAIVALQELIERVSDSLAPTWNLRRLTRRHFAHFYVAPDVDDEDADGNELKYDAEPIDIGPIETDELVDVLHRCFAHNNHPIALPDTAIIEGVFRESLDLEGVIADQDMQARFQPTVGGLVFEVVQLETFKKGGTSPNALSVVTNFPMPLRTHVRAIAASAQSVERKADRRFALLKNNSDRRPGKRRNLATEKKASSAENVDTDASRWWHWNVKVVVASGKASTANIAARRIAKMMTSAGFGSRIERLGNPSALAASWPGNSADDRSESLIDTTTLCDLAPTASVYRGPDTHPNPNPTIPYNPPIIRALTIGKTPINLYDTVQDVAHMGVLGEIGAGKSTDSNGLIYLDRCTSPNVEHLILDQGYGAETLVRAYGGVFIDADPSNPETGTCPYDRIEDEEERAIWTQWTLDNLRMQDLIIDPQREENVQKAIRQLATSPLRSTSLLQRKLATYDQDAAKALTPWTINGVGGYLFDVESAELRERDADIQCYELSRLMRYNDSRLTGPLATLAFNRLLRRQLKTTSKIRVHIDEPSDVFAHPIFRPILASYYDKIARKNGGGVRIFTQHADHFLKHDISTSILSGTKTWWFKANKEVGGSLRELFIDKFQVTSEICDLIATAQPKRHTVVWQNGHASLINPTWLPEELDWIGSTGKREREAIAQLRRAHPKTYPGMWFAQRGHHDAAKRWYKNALAMGAVTNEDIAKAA